MQLNKVRLSSTDAVSKMTHAPTAIIEFACYFKGALPAPVRPGLDTAEC